MSISWFSLNCVLAPLPLSPNLLAHEEEHEGNRDQDSCETGKNSRSPIHTYVVVHRCNEQRECTGEH